MGFGSRIRRAVRRVERDIERGPVKSSLPSPDFVQAFDVIPEVEKLVGIKAVDELAGIQSRLEAAKAKRLRQRGLINTIITGRLGAPTEGLGNSPELETSQRRLFGG